MRQDAFNQNNLELKSKNKYSVNQTRTRQQNVVHQSRTTYIEKKLLEPFFRAARERQGGGDTTEQHA